MILVTVGTQLPFDRLVTAVDEWAAECGRSDVFAQIGSGGAVPSHIRWARNVTQEEFRSLAAEADAVVSHAGIGSILMALELGKPIIVMPRSAALGEHRNEHQKATAEKFRKLGYVEVAEDAGALKGMLSRISDGSGRKGIAPYASPRLLTALKDFFRKGDRPDACFDGVLCFGGEDWWYHNRGHYDIQMARRLSTSLPVLYVNSIGMRMPAPAEGAMFRKRIARKLRSFLRGLRKVGKNLFVYSPVTAPGWTENLIGGMLLRMQLRMAMRLVGIRRPLIWIAVPSAVITSRRLANAAMVYQRTDSFEHLTGVDPAKVRALDREAKLRADVTVFCSTFLYEKERGECRRALYTDHGVDFERYFTAGREAPGPVDLESIPHPRIGFVGGIDALTFDPELFVETARRMPDCSFVMVGACSLPKGWCTLPNVHFLGRKSYESVPRYMAGSDVLIMPWNRGEWIKACNPVKMKEYFAVGKPVVSTYFPEVEKYKSYVRIAGTPEEFEKAIRESLSRKLDAAPIQEAMRGETWEKKVGLVLDALGQNAGQLNV